LSFISALHLLSGNTRTLGEHEDDEEDLNEIEKLAIMVDADEEGYLLQILLSLFKIDYFIFLKSFKNENQVLVQVTSRHF
jgi:hypothetical protein